MTVPAVVRNFVAVAVAVAAPLWAAHAVSAEPVDLTLRQTAALVRHHVPLSGLRANTTAAFPEVVAVSRVVPDAGPFFVGGFVRNAWFGPSADWTSSDAWPQMTRAALLGRDWPHLPAVQREALALRWIETELPAGHTAQSKADGPPDHLPRAFMDGGDVLVQAWVDWHHESRGGMRFNRADHATVYLFKRDGTVQISPE